MASGSAAKSAAHLWIASSNRARWHDTIKPSGADPRAGQTVYLPILKRCGVVLIAVGALDIAYMVWCIAHDRSYSSSLNIFALVAGILLVRGSLKTARWVAMSASFLFAASALAIVVLPFLYPIGYWLALLRHSSGVAASIVIALALLSVLFWLRQQLLRPEVLKAEEDAGIRPPRVRLAATTGALLPVLLTLVLGLMFHGDTAKEAIRRAHRRLSGNYHYVVTSMQMNSTGTEKHVTAVVTAYNATALRTIPVQWKE